MLPILCLKPRCYSDEDIVDDLEKVQLKVYLTIFFILVIIIK